MCTDLPHHPILKHLLFVLFLQFDEPKLQAHATRHVSARNLYTADGLSVSFLHIYPPLPLARHTRRLVPGYKAGEAWSWHSSQFTVQASNASDLRGVSTYACLLGDPDRRVSVSMWECVSHISFHLVKLRSAFAFAFHNEPRSVCLRDRSSTVNLVGASEVKMAVGPP